jgi:hypothetical protein
MACCLGLYRLQYTLENGVSMQMGKRHKKKRENLPASNRMNSARRRLARCYSRILRVLHAGHPQAVAQMSWHAPLSYQLLQVKNPKNSPHENRARDPEKCSKAQSRVASKSNRSCFTVFCFILSVTVIGRGRDRVFWFSFWVYCEEGVNDSYLISDVRGNENMDVLFPLRGPKKCLSGRWK